MRAKLKVILPLLLLIYIATETILKSRGIEVCEAQGCKLAGDLLWFDSTYLNYMGMLGAFGLVILGLLRGEFFNRLYIVAAAAMVIFESLLIASQININPEPCLFCLGVYSFLIAILINANFKVFIYAIPAITALFVAFSFLAIPKNKSLINKPGLYLISSKDCPHCKKAKEFLNKEGIKYSVIDSSDINAFSFAKSLNITKIPIAIDAKKSSYQIIVGDKAIIDNFGKKKQDNSEEKNEPKKEENSTPQIQQENKSSLYGSEDEGCGYSITAPPKECESSDGNSTK